MDEGREVLARLQASGLADTDLDYDAVMADLARGRLPMSVLTSAAGPGIGATVITGDQRRLVEELVAIARAPFSEVEQPEVPDIPWARIADDLRGSTGRVLVLAFRWEPFSDHSFLMCDLSVDGNALGGCSINWDADDPEGSLADLADQLCEGWLHEEVWGGWPMCRRHRTRPMWATVSADGAIWACEADPLDSVPIGALTA